TTDPESEASRLLVDTDSDLSELRWDEALNKSDRILGMATVSQRLRDLAAQKKVRAESEKQVQGTYDQFTSAGGQGKYDEAFALYARIPPESAYRAKATELHKQLWPVYAKQHIEAAEAARTKGECAQFAAEVKKVLQLEPGH